MPQHYTKNQTIVLIITPVITGSLSSIASASIMSSILRSSVRLRVPYRRIVFGMSFFDILASMSWAVSSLPMPKTSGLMGAYGNQGTCDAQGFFMNVGITGSLIYSVALGYYFDCIIRQNLRYEDFRKHSEIWLHTVPTIANVALGIYCIADGLINPWMTFCAPGSPSPSDCLVDPDVLCERGSRATIHSYISFGVLGISILMICVFFLSISWRVVRQEIRNRRQLVQIANNAAGGNVSRVKRALQWVQNKLSSRGRSIIGNGEGDESQQGRGQRQGRTSNVSQFGVVGGPLANRNLRRQSLVGRASERREREAKVQAILYIVGTLLTHTSTIVSIVRFALGFQESFASQFCVVLFAPLQGVTNVLVYTHPHVAALRRANPDYSWWTAFKSTIQSGGDHDQMERWRQMRRARMIRRNQESFARRVMLKCQSFLSFCQHTIEGMKTKCKHLRPGKTAGRKQNHENLELSNEVRAPDLEPLNHDSTLGQVVGNQSVELDLELEPASHYPLIHTP